jgi:hypothetical protein
MRRTPRAWCRANLALIADRCPLGPAAAIPHTVFRAASSIASGFTVANRCMSCATTPFARLDVRLPARPVVPVEVIAERQAVAPDGVSLELLGHPEHRAAAVLVLLEYVGEATPDLPFGLVP